MQLTQSPEATLKGIPSKRIRPIDSVPAVRGFVDFCCRADDGAIACVGWLYDPQKNADNYVLLKEVKSSLMQAKTYEAILLEPAQEGVGIEYCARPDVACALGKEEENYGFVVVAKWAPEKVRLGIALKDGTFALLPFSAEGVNNDINIAFTQYGMHSGAAFKLALQAALSISHPWLESVKPGVLPERNVNQPAPWAGVEQGKAIQSHVECVLWFESGLILIGWGTFLPGANIWVREADENTWARSTRMEDVEGAQSFRRTFRPDVRESLSPREFAEGNLGFALYWPIRVDAPSRLAFYIEGGTGPQEGLVAISPGIGRKSLLDKVWLHTGSALKEFAGNMPDNGIFAEYLKSYEGSVMTHTLPGVMAIDHAFLFNNRALILNGWISKPFSEIKKVLLLTSLGECEITEQVVRYTRPDVSDSAHLSKKELFGFVCLVDLPVALACNVCMRVICQSGEEFLESVAVEIADWSTLASFVLAQKVMADSLLRLLEKSPLGSLDNGLPWLDQLKQAMFRSSHKKYTQKVEVPDKVLAYIDRAFLLGETGLLIFGWAYFPMSTPLAMTLHGASGKPFEVKDKMFPLFRRDVQNLLKKRFPAVPEKCGFVTFAPVPARHGEPLALCFDFGHEGQVWAKVPTDQTQPSGVELVKKILDEVKNLDLLKSEIYQIFCAGLGPAIETAHQSRSTTPPAIRERQYGPPVLNPSISVIVPLYGRCDFLRHQLAHFADDPDFAHVDLIYVVDDPHLLAATIDLASQVYPIFLIPFRVLDYQQNLGFAGANNVGVRAARAETVVLLNSDIIPQHTGWLSLLHRELANLPDAGAVAPLLFFDDGAIQHAGMVPQENPHLPGFLMNSHPGKGRAWCGSERPSEHPLLTAACLMLRRSDYLAVGGLDEGYILGDFEDSDLCLALRQRGKRLWLIPQAKLWHLERQSQNVSAISNYRQLVTLFNGWRYRQKIETGQIGDPQCFEVTSCES